MNRYAARIVLLLLLFGVAFSAADAQRRPRPFGFRSEGAGAVFVEAAQFPSDSTGFARIDVFIRVAYEFMVFERKHQAQRDTLFHGGVEVSTHIRQDGTTLVSEYASAEAAAAGYESTHLEDRFVLVHQVFHVPPGAYEILFTATDVNSTREQQQRIPFRAVSLQGDSLRIGHPVSLTRDAASGRDRYAVFGYAGALPFAESALVGIPASRYENVDWNVRLLRPGEDDENEILYEETVQPGSVLHNLRPLPHSGEVDGFSLREGGAAQGVLVLLELPFARFDIGSYRLDVIARDAEGADSVRMPVRIYWRDMPRSLRSIEFAISAMRYILTREEFEEMRDGEEQEMREKFRAFWRGKDPTPATEYNEMLTEYFRRVDEAVEKFHTLFQRNGAFTDRGKVYILFGPPEETQRVLGTDEPTEEIWYYPSLNKTFRFVDREKNGDLKLSEE